MVQPSRPRRVAVVAATPVSMFNLAIPELLFERVEVDGERGYETVICAPEPGPVPTTGGLDLHVRQGLDVVRDADLVLVVGTGHRYTPDPRTVSALSEAAAARQAHRVHLQRRVRPGRGRAAGRAPGHDLLEPGRGDAQTLSGGRPHR